jgi:hypothetical protein
MEALVAIAVLITLFLIFRAFVLWYWRVNESIELLKGINEKLDRLAPPQAPGAGAGRVSPSVGVSAPCIGESGERL